MVQFTVTILQFAEQGEKTGWTYIKIPSAIAQKLKPGYRKSFRVKGKLDDYGIQRIALIPMGDGDFIMALKAEIRRAIKKRKGAKLNVLLEVDDRPLKLSAELMDCLADEPRALVFFKSLAKSHQHYFSKWIEDAKTESTKTKRIAQTIIALSRGFHFGQMLRSIREDNNDLMKK